MHVSFYECNVFSVHAGRCVVSVEGLRSPGEDAGQRNMFLCWKNMDGHATFAYGSQAEMQ